MKISDLTNYSLKINNIEYTFEKNKRYSNFNFWTVFSNNKKFATVEYTKNNGWISTFQTKGLNSALWMVSSKEKYTIEKCIKSLHKTNENFQEKILVG